MNTQIATNSDQSTAETTGTTRRQVLKAVAGTGLLLLLPMVPGQAAADAGKWYPMGKSADYSVNEPKRVTVGTIVLWVTRTDAKHISAVSAKCTHKGCELGWDAAQTQLLCPCHGAAFGTDGHNIHGTRRTPTEKLPALAVAQVREKDGQVEVNFTPATPA